MTVVVDANIVVVFGLADERLYNAVKDGFPNIRWLSDWLSEA
jgi:hypothetical protein